VARPSNSHPTELELEILKILWSEGPLPVSAVREALASGPTKRRCAHTTVITMLNIMVDKGYAKRAQQGGKIYVYDAVAKEKLIKGRMLTDLIDRVFNGSAADLMLNVLEKRDLDEEELRRIRQLINIKAKEAPK